MVKRMVLACALAGAAFAAAADIVVLTNGNRVEGKVVARDKESVTIRVKNAELAIRRDDIKQIIEQDTPRELYSRMLEDLGEDDAVGHYQVALYCDNEGLTGEAVQLLRRALELKPDYPEAEKKLKEIIGPAARELFERAEKLAAAGRHATARETYKRLVESFAESDLADRASAAIAESYFRQQNYPAAMEQWKDVIKQDRRNTTAYLGVIRICEHIGQFEKAVEILNAVLHYEKDDRIREQCNEKKAVITRIIERKKLIEQEPGNPDDYARLAREFEKLGHERAAARWMETAVEKGSRDLPGVEKLARYYDAHLRVVKALKCWSYLKGLAPPPGLAREADGRIARLTLLNLIPEYVQTSSAARCKEIVEKLEDAALPFSLIEAVLREWLDFPRPHEKGIVTCSVELADGSAASYVLFVPENYDPYLRQALIIALHGAGGTGDRYILNWAGYAQQQGCLVLAPTSDRGRGWRAAGGEVVEKSLADVRKNFNIDTNRIFIDGTSMGAQGAWLYGLQAPDLFAGLVSRSGAVNAIAQLLLPNARNLPVYIVHGLKDSIAPADNIKSVREKLIKLGCDVEFRLDIKSGHSTFANETPKIMQWMAARSRNPYPEDVRFTLRSLTRPRSYWLQAELLTDEVFDPSRKIAVPKVGGQPLSGEMLDNYFLAAARAGMGILNGKIQGNVVKVKTRHLIGYTVLLNDRMLDLDEPVAVYTNGKKTYYGKVARSVPFMLEWARRHRDPEMLFSAYVRIVVRDGK